LSESQGREEDKRYHCQQSQQSYFGHTFSSLFSRYLEEFASGELLKSKSHYILF